MRDRGAMIVYVHVDLANFMKLPADKYMRDPNGPPPPAEASQLAPEAGFRDGDVLITKRQWGAFFGTDLEHQLRQRNIRTIVLGGIATNYGVESTARAAAGLGFELVIVEDATTTMKAELHQFSFENIFPYISRVRSTAQVLAAFK